MKATPDSLVEIDGRTKEARLIRNFSARLLAIAGGRPSDFQRELIEQAVQIKLRLAMLDRSLARTGSQTRRERETYASMAARLHAILRDLGDKPAAAPSKPVKLSDYLRTHKAPPTQPPPTTPTPPRAA